MNAKAMGSSQSGHAGTAALYRGTPARYTEIRMTHRLATCLVLAALPAVLPAQGGGRVRPPDAVTCPRDRLTVYTGRVLSMDRRRDSTSLVIATDWKTTERVTISHPDGGDPAVSFLMKGKPFAVSDWPAIATDGKLRADARASAWVCGDGRNPVIDWEAKTTWGAGL
jgi:hypothetical protein